MIFYLFFFILIVFLLQVDKMGLIKRVNLKLIAFIIIFLFCALRFDVGYDYMYYQNLITKNIDFYEEMFNRMEFFNRGLISISQAINFPQFYFIVTSFIIIFLIYDVLKRESHDFLISTLIFLSFPIFFLSSLSIIRQYVAITIIFYSYRFIKSKKIIQFLTCVFLAFLFHKSAIIAVVLYWLYDRHINSIYYIVLYFVGLFSSQFAIILVGFFFPEYVTYLERALGTGGDKLLILFQILGFFMLFFINRKKKNNTNYNFYMATFFLGLFIWSSLASYGHAGFRGSLYFIIFFVLLFPELLTIIKQKKIIEYLMYLICFVFFVFSLWLGMKNTTKDPNIPYRVYFISDITTFKKDIKFE